MHIYTENISAQEPLWKPNSAIVPSFGCREAPKAANDTPSQTMKIADEAYEETYALFTQLILSLPLPRRSFRFESRVVALREDVHKRCRLEGLTWRREIQKFFVELKPIVSATDYDTENDILMRESPVGFRYREVVSRKSVEGDCGICLSPLENPTNVPPHSVKAGNCIHYVGNSGKNHLIWCKARCGANYHFDCFTKWSKHFRHHQRATCPLCREYWEG